MDIPSVGVLRSEKNFDQRSFANAVGADQSYPPTGRQLNADVAKKVSRSVCLGESGCSKHAERRYRTPVSGNAVFGLSFCGGFRNRAATIAAAGIVARM